MKPLPPEVLLKVLEDKDFILTRRFDFSVEKMLERYPDGAPDRAIAQALGIEEHEVEPWYLEVVDKIREMVKATDSN